MTELERIEQAEEYYRRYLQKEEAIVQNRENQEYITKYIHEDTFVTASFNLKDKLTKGIGVSAAAGLVLFFLVLIATHLLPALVLGLFVGVGGTIFFSSLYKYRLDAELQHQHEVNEGIAEQIQILKEREPQLIAEKDAFAEGLEKRVTFISLSEMKYLGELRNFIESGEAETCEDATMLLEQKMLFEQFNLIMENTEIEKTYTDAENKARFGDPIKQINEKNKKSLKEKLFGKKKKK
ncbi:hypothetical protein SAMN02910447_02068 [Ruminococcus sp. YE71]|uniref:hypothetical protein n=1 Tax=unclassified Ruminococcus TaxID=2608920 RepID=UPI000883B5F6|nr:MULTISPECIES: hypothetical protein [unclassified Ruminococcus]SDA21673.1 hypothetical protein SAMN02910446_01937 [Ruminococcus sp. YE78]SFW36637.1 hypothetical protein SAMN02910447_02068 [Ruminococcus sp. YE71]